MKVRTAVRRLGAGCSVVRRRGKIFIVCKLDARHKQRQGFHTLALEAARAAPDPPAPQSRTLGPPDARALLGENPWALSVVTTWSALGEPLRRLFPRF